MGKLKALAVVLVHVALAIFVLVMVWPMLKGNNDGYSGAVPVTTNVVDVEAVNTEMKKEIVKVINTAAEVKDRAMAKIEKAPEKIEAVVEKVIAAIPHAVVTKDEPEARSQIHIVTAQGLKYAPLVIMVALGDTVAWENMSSHDTQAIEGLVPEGSEMWHSSMGDNYQRTFTQEGIYIYKCTPHFGAGMGGVIIVGKPVNLEAIKAAQVKGAAKRLVKKAIKAAEAM